MRRTALLALAWAGLALAVGAAPGAAKAPPSRAFFGVVPQGPLTTSDFARMRGVVGTLRIPLFWSRLEPRAGELELAETDRVVLAAAEAGVRVLPFVYGTPPWLARDPARPPLAHRSLGAWKRFLRTLVRRYGPGGTLWAGRSARLPIRQWQIWNEPNFLLFWRPRPSPAGYARLLRASADAIRGSDPGARIVAAGVAPVEGGTLPWTFLRKLYAVPGVARVVDVVAVHPYSPSLSGMAYQIRRARQVLAGAGAAREPLLVSELGVASGARLPTGFDRGPRGQASFLRGAYRLLMRERARWRIAGVDWFAWRDLSASDTHCVFCESAGLFDAAGRPKPAWRALLRVAATGARPRLHGVR